MSKSRAQKAGEIEILTKAFKQGKAIAFADFRGMTVPAVTKIRKTLKASSVDYIVAKKTLLALAAKEAGLTIDFSAMPGMLGAAFANEDEMAAAKLLGEASKTNPLKLVGGVFDGKVVGEAEIVALSKLPGKKELLAQLLNVMQGPASAFARLLNAYKDQKGGVSA
jgi:large subunit ribosomal protein L10